MTFHESRLSGRKFIFIFFLALFFLTSGCAMSQQRRAAQPTPYHARVLQFTRLPMLGHSRDGQSIELGGFSGLQLIQEGQDQYQFLTLTDRGPNGVIRKGANQDVWERPFLLPQFSPRLVYFTLQSQTGQLKVDKQIILRAPNGRPLTGVPPASQSHVQLESAQDEYGRMHKPDLMGIDPEGVVRDGKGQFWVCDEYRPSIMRFSADGRLLEMYVAPGFYSDDDKKQLVKLYGRSSFLKEILPVQLLDRKVNRGFEGIALRNDQVVAMLQSPLPTESSGERAVRFFVLDPRRQLVRETFYTLESLEADKLGDIAVEGNQIYTLEQNSRTGPNSTHLLYQVTWSEGQDGAVRLNNKQLLADLAALGVQEFEKMEGLAILPNGVFAVVVDNDFGLTESDNRISIDPQKKPYLIILSK